ncbi:MAG TPA: TetR/AcrR family transcriptional regulator [Dongiaceae bacterium]|nr:TetR/AcrR family transcriptional regulator [Dongiaceae bacterium]
MELEPKQADGCDEGDECARARRRDKEATKCALIEAAVATFAARGFDGATTKEVAARAGVNEGLIQRYFAHGNMGGKAGLLQAILGGLCGERLTACRMKPAADGPTAEITQFLQHEIEQAQSNRDLLRVMLSRALVDPDLAQSMKQHYSQSRIPFLIERLRPFQADGRLDPAVDLQALAETIAVFAYGLGFMQQLVFAEDRTRLDALVASTAETIMRGASA